MAGLHGTPRGASGDTKGMNRRLFLIAMLALAFVGVLVVAVLSLADDNTPPRPTTLERCIRYYEAQNDPAKVELCKRTYGDDNGSEWPENTQESD